MTRPVAGRRRSMVGLSDADSNNSLNGFSKQLLVGLSDANAKKWSSLFDQITLAKMGAAAPRKQPTAVYRKTVTKLCQPQKRHSDGEVVDLVAAYRAGASVYELAEQFGCRRQTVSAWLKSQGVQMRGRPLTPAQIDEAERLYAAGRSLASVGEQLGVWSSTVRKYLRTRGVVMRPPYVKHY